MGMEPNMATPMTIRLGMTEPSKIRRGATLALTLATLVSVAVYLAATSAAIGRVLATRPMALIAGWHADHAVIAPIMSIRDDTLRRAVSGRPLDARLVNIAMMKSIGQGGDGMLARWIPVLSKLGWRDTAALQNRLYAAATNDDLGAVMNISDALMRRQQAQEQIIPVLSITEGDVMLRGELVRRLADNPGWRGRYLFATGHLRTPAQLEARYALLTALRRRGVALDRSSLVSNVNALVGGGLPEQGFALWAGSQQGISRPLNDTDFARASVNDASVESNVPFEWEITNGAGYSVGAYSEAGKSELDIQWDGRGVPVFVRQRTSANPGRYAINLDVDPESVRDLSALGLRLICNQTGYDLQQRPGLPTHFVTLERIPCSYPILEIAGDIRAGATPRHIELRKVRMVRIRATEEKG